MLAHKVNDKKIDFTEPVFIQPKLDGVRCLIRTEFDSTVNADVIRAYSRTGKQFHNSKTIY